jgi:hypothetical protein
LPRTPRLADLDLVPARRLEPAPRALPHQVDLELLESANVLAPGGFGHRLGQGE